MRHPTVGIEVRGLANRSAVGQVRGESRTAISVTRLNNDAGATDIADEVSFEHHHSLLAIYVLITQSPFGSGLRNDQIVDVGRVGTERGGIDSFHISPLERHIRATNGNVERDRHERGGRGSSARQTIRRDWKRKRIAADDPVLCHTVDEELQTVVGIHKRQVGRCGCIDRNYERDFAGGSRHGHAHARLLTGDDRAGTEGVRRGSTGRKRTQSLAEPIASGWSRTGPHKIFNPFVKF